MTRVETVATTRVESKAETLSVAVCQLTSVDDFDVNVASIVGLLDQLREDPPDLVSFPENALFFRLKEGVPVYKTKLVESGFQVLAQKARELQTVLHIGSVARDLDGRTYNSTLFIMPDGRVLDHYQKIHLFDVDVAGHKPIRESDVFEAGSKPAIIEIKGWKIGCSICYDLRFAELFLTYAKLEVDAILIPSAFLVATGQAHWNVLMRARAIESQTYVLAAAQGGMHENAKGDRRSTFGHSMIVDPWGEVLAEVQDGQSPVLRAILSQEKIAKVRSQIPMKNHRRLV